MPLVLSFVNIMRKRSYFSHSQCVFSYYYYYYYYCSYFMTTFIFGPLFGSSHLFCCFLFLNILCVCSVVAFSIIVRSSAHTRTRTWSEYIFLTLKLSDANQFNGIGKVEEKKSTRKNEREPTKRGCEDHSNTRTQFAARIEHLTFKLYLDVAWCSVKVIFPHTHTSMAAFAS